VLADGLKLNATQTSKIQAIQDQYSKDRRALFSDQGGDRQEMMQKMQGLTEETTKAIEGVLTESQNKQAPGYIKSISGYQMVGIPLGAIPELKLTSSQKSSITAIAEGAQKQMADAMAKRQAENANGGGGPGGGGPGGGFQAMQEMMKPNIDKAAAVLTATQKATLAKYIADHPQRGFGGGRGGGGGRRGGGGGAAGGGNGPV
jgi:Spy/CpxP family protein refolding chaperone